MKRAAVLFIAVLVAGCASRGSRDADHYFVLEATPRPELTRQTSPAVRVAPTSASSFYDTQNIVYSRTPGTRAYYRFNHWTERPQRAIHAQLAALLETTGAPARLVLNTHLEEIYHHAAEPPGTVRITLHAQLVDTASRAVVARRDFSHSVPASAYDAPGAVQGLRQALGTLLSEVVAWVDANALPNAKR